MKPRQLLRTPYYYGWNVVALCVLSLLFSNGIALNCFSLFVPIWSQSMAAPPSRILLAVTISTSLALVINPVVGWAADRFPINRLMSFGLVLTALGYLAVANARSAAALTVIYPTILAVGIASATLVPAQTVVSRWFVRCRGLAMGITAGGLVIAGIVFPPLVVLALPWLGWRMIWLLGAIVIGCGIAPLVALALYNHPAGDDISGYLGRLQDQPVADAASMRAILLRPNFWMLTLIALAILGTYFNGTVNAASFILSRGFDMTMAGFILSLISASAFVGSLLFGTLADWCGNRLSLLLLSLIAALGSAGLCVAESRWLLFLAAIPVGLCGGIWVILPSALAAEFGSASLGRAFGVITAIVPFAIVAAPWAAHVKEQTGHYDHALLILAILGLLGAALCLLLRQPKSGNPGAPLRETSFPAVASDATHSPENSPHSEQGLAS